jgi:hypothetical protein
MTLRWWPTVIRVSSVSYSWDRFSGALAGALSAVDGAIGTGR